MNVRSRRPLRTGDRLTVKINRTHAYDLTAALSDPILRAATAAVPKRVRRGKAREPPRYGSAKELWRLSNPSVSCEKQVVKSCLTQAADAGQVADITLIYPDESLKSCMRPRSLPFFPVPTSTRVGGRKK